jgi:hypothetical protein
MCLDQLMQLMLHGANGIHVTHKQVEDAYQPRHSLWGRSRGFHGPRCGRGGPSRGNHLQQIHSRVQTLETLVGFSVSLDEMRVPDLALHLVLEIDFQNITKANTLQLLRKFSNL